MIPTFEVFICTTCVFGFYNVAHVKNVLPALFKRGNEHMRLTGHEVIHYIPRPQ